MKRKKTYTIEQVKSLAEEIKSVDVYNGEVLIHDVFFWLRPLTRKTLLALAKELNIATRNNAHRVILERMIDEFHENVYWKVKDSVRCMGDNI